MDPVSNFLEIISSKMHPIKKHNIALTGMPTFDQQVSASCCAQAALAVQAQGTPLAHKKYSVAMAAGTPTFEG